MRNLIKKILKEQDFEDFDFVPEFEENPAKEFIYNLMQGLEISESKKQPGWMIYKDKSGEILMADDANAKPERPALYVNYYKIWKKLEEMGLYGGEIKQVLISVLEMTFNRKVLQGQEVWSKWLAAL